VADAHLSQDPFFRLSTGWLWAMTDIRIKQHLKIFVESDLDYIMSVQAIIRVGPVRCHDRRVCRRERRAVRAFS
jgi:hypothetical protein